MHRQTDPISSCTTNRNGGSAPFEGGHYCVYRYPNSSVKAKGEEDAAGNRIGKWYLYSETGRLSVEENGVVRKPTKEEKASHESYLQELVGAKR